MRRAGDEAWCHQNRRAKRIPSRELRITCDSTVDAFAQKIGFRRGHASKARNSEIALRVSFLTTPANAVRFSIGGVFSESLSPARITIARQIERRKISRPAAV